MKLLGLLLFLFAIPVLFLNGCGSDGEGENELSEFELKHGVGPVDEPIEIIEINTELAAKGEQLFETRCTACHQLEVPITGPALANVANNREPAFIMNYILNPLEMRQRHPVAKELSQEYPGVMTDQGLDREQARAVVEFLTAYARD